MTTIELTRALLCALTALCLCTCAGIAWEKLRSTGPAGGDVMAEYYSYIGARRCTLLSSWAWLTTGLFFLFQ